MPVTNRDRFPDVDWLTDIKQVGDVGGTPLVLIGYAPGVDADQKQPVVARAYTSDPSTEDLFAVPLYELLNHSPDPVNIDGTT